jgi:YegS/Rv2252/BmrU family lipid kinase
MNAAAAESVYERKEALIIINPTAHNAPGPKRRAAIDEWVEEQGWKVAWHETSEKDEAIGVAADAARRRVPLVIACGGDGTLNEAANGLVGSDTALGMIPGGTSNLWARDVGLDKKPLEAVQLMIEGERRLVDMGRVCDRYFLLLAGFGIDARVTQSVPLRVKSRIGAAAYGLSAFKEVWGWKGTRVRMRIDDGPTEEHDVLMMLAGNTRLYAGLTKITPAAVVDDGRLDLCIYTGRSRFDIFRHVALTLTQQHRKSPKVLYRRIRKAEFEWEEPLPVQVDGDPLGECPSEVEVAPSCLWVAVPAGLETTMFSRPAGRGRAPEPSLRQP